jgi:hypothetical protein
MHGAVRSPTVGPSLGRSGARSRRRPGHRLPYPRLVAVGVGALGILAILLLAPLGGSTSAPVTWGAPYTGNLTPHLYNQIEHQSCTGYSFPHASSFNLTTGVATGMVSTSATGCGLPSGPYIQVGQVVSLSTGRITVPTDGNYTMNATWQVTFTVNLTVSNVSGGSRGFAESEIIIWDSWRDLTTGGEVNGSSVDLNSEQIVYVDGQLTFHSTNTSSAQVVLPMVTGHAYQLIAHFAAFSESFVIRGTGAHAKTVVNWATNGNQARLTSLSLA